MNCEDITDKSTRTLCVDTSISEQDYELQFTKFISDFDKQYSSQKEMNDRFKIFKENYLKIQVHNTDPNKTYSQEINQFSDLTTKEFEDQYLSKLAEEDPDQREQILLGSSNEIQQQPTQQILLGNNNNDIKSNSEQQQMRGSTQAKDNKLENYIPKLFKGTRAQKYKLIVLNKNAELSQANYRYRYNEEIDDIEKFSIQFNQI